jgi:hypothetical protein
LSGCKAVFKTWVWHHTHVQYLKPFEVEVQQVRKFVTFTTGLK